MPPWVCMRPLETLSNVELAVTVELGRTRLLMRELLSLRPGSVVELDRHVGAPVDVFVNSTLLAHGEVVVVDDELGVRITAIAGGADGPGEPDDRCPTVDRTLALAHHAADRSGRPGPRASRPRPCSSRWWSAWSSSSC